MNLNTEEQEELDLALAISLSEQDRKSCSQSDAFLTSNEIHTNKILSGNQADPTRFPQIGRIVDPDLRPYNDIRARDDLKDRHDRTTGRLNQLPYGSSSSDLLTDSRVSLNTQMTQSIPASDNDSSRTLQNLPHRLAKQLYGDISQNFIDPYACAGCRRLILGTYLNADGSRYHPECFTCAGCNGQLLGSHFPKGNPPLPYHKECAEELFNPRCCLCDAVLKGQYLRHSFFEEEVYCVTHVGSRQCFACSRKEPSSLGGCKREGFTELHDGRVSCMECISTAIVDSQEALPLYLEAVDFMERVLGLRIPLGMRDIPVLAVDLPSLDEQQTSTKTGHTGSESVTRGLTLIKIGQVLYYITNKLRTLGIATYALI